MKIMKRLRKLSIDEVKNIQQTYIKKHPYDTYTIANIFSVVIGEKEAEQRMFELLNMLGE